MVKCFDTLKELSHFLSDESTDVYLKFYYMLMALLSVVMRSMSDAEYDVHIGVSRN